MRNCPHVLWVTKVITTNQNIRYENLSFHVFSVGVIHWITLWGFTPYGLMYLLEGFVGKC